MNKYYAEKLSAERLQAVYDLATPRITQYLDAEISFVLDRIGPEDEILDLGCGYGRSLAQFASKAGSAWGIDNSLSNLQMGREYLCDHNNVCLSCMSAGRMGFADGSFDLVICIQNGISAFKVDPAALIREAVRVTRSGGTVLLSTYSEKLWKDRLRWFELQSEAGLLGEIDREATGDGVIVCKDGFKATTFSRRQFSDLAESLGLKATITEVDRSSLFCAIEV